jgi:hypothetical protein
LFIAGVFFILAGCSSTEKKALGPECLIKLKVTTGFASDFASENMNKDEDAFFTEMFMSVLNTDLPKNFIPVVNIQEIADFDIQIMKAHLTPRRSSVAGNIIIKFVNVSTGKSEMLRGVDVSNTYWTSTTGENAYRLAMSKVVASLPTKFKDFCKG